MAWFKYDIEVRREGAIGIFTNVTQGIRAETIQKAKEWAIADARNEGFEPRNILQIMQVTKEEYDQTDHEIGDIL